MFLNNPDSFFCVSDVMKSARVCWASARDNIVLLRSRGWIIKTPKGYVLNNVFFSIRKNS